MILMRIRDDLIAVFLSWQGMSLSRADYPSWSLFWKALIPEGPHSDGPLSCASFALMLVLSWDSFAPDESSILAWDVPY